jgi:hypothetical protein
LSTGRAGSPGDDRDVLRAGVPVGGEPETAWQQDCAPFLIHDISVVTGKQVKAFPELIAEIKPTKYPSRVLTCRFCHFLLR